jgi:hypothetical protein
MQKFLAGVAVLLLLTLPAFGQGANASLSGTVTDASGGVLPGVAVKATNNATGVVTPVVTNAAGVYTFASLPPGIYKLSAELAGFQTQTFTDLQLRSSAQVRLNVTLEVKKLEQQVEVSVSADTLLLESSSSVGLVLPEKKVVELPLVNNNVLDLIKVMGGTVMTDQNPIFNANDTVMAGVSAGNINLQRDGVSINEVRWGSGMNSALRLNNEMVGEFKILLSPVDAEVGRGNGQVQMITKSGANNYHGGVVYTIQNTALDSNQFYLNKTNTAAPWRNMHELSASVGGPIIKNKTFFYVFYDQQLARQRNSINAPVLTPCARKGIFRYFDGWNNGNINSAVTTTGFAPQRPVVDVNGNPVTPATNPNGTPFTGQLRAYSVFGQLLKTPKTNDCSDFNPATDVASGTNWDPYRKALDASGFITRFTELMPAANNYEIGDGLNTAGQKWLLRYKGGDNVYGLGEDQNRKQINVKIDHNFNERHRISGNYSFEKSTAEDSFASWPNGYGGAITRKPQMVSLNFTSTLRPTLLNEFRFGMARTQNKTYDALDNPDTGQSMTSLMQKLLPTDGFANYKGLPLLVEPGSNMPGFHTDVWSTGFTAGGGIASNPVGSRGNLPVTFGGYDPRWTYADTITWTKGRHSFKGGAELRLSKSYQERTGTGSFSNDVNVYAQAVGGATTLAPVSGINGGNMPGLVGFSGFYNVGNMEGLLNYMAGSLANVRQYLFVNSPTALTWSNYSKGDTDQIFDIRMHELSLFFKDDWKVNDALTLNLGLRWEYYGVPYVQSGMTVGLDGGPNAIFGVSGRSFDNWLTGTAPAPQLSLATKQIFVGPNSPNSGQQVFNDDWNNFGPAVGFAWQLPWFGKGKTTLRGGYQISYLPIGRADTFSGPIANTIGTSYRNVYVGDSATPYLDIAHLSSYTPVPVPANAIPLAPIPITQRTQGYTVFDQNLVSPYVQNLTLALVRNIGSNITVDVRYVGTLTRKNLGTLNINSVNFLNNGLLEAFNAARNGQQSAFLDKLFNGVNLQGMGACGAVGTTCNGVLQTGADQLRNSTMTNSAYATFQSLLANGNYSGLAGALGVANYNRSYPGNTGLPALVTGVNGTLLRATGTQENFIYTNPQFSAANLTGNMNYSNYHSMQAQVTLRPTAGFSFVGTYTWSRNLGLAGAYTNPLDRASDYTLLSGHRAHQLVTYGTFDLPFGRNRSFFKDTSKTVDHIIGGWQISWIGNIVTGSPNSLAANSMLYANGAPDFVGPAGSFDTKMGQVEWAPGAIDGNYFGRKYSKVKDPQCTRIASVLQASCTLQALALASDNSVIVMQQPQPGTQGNFGRMNMTNLGRWTLDMAISKQFRVTESKSFQLRIDATNIFNHPTPSNGYTTVSTRSAIAANPDMSLAGTNPLGYLNNKVGNRNFQAKLRFDF